MLCLQAAKGKKEPNKLVTSSPYLHKLGLKVYEIWHEYALLFCPMIQSLTFKQKIYLISLPAK